MLPDSYYGGWDIILNSCLFNIRKNAFVYFQFNAMQYTQLLNDTDNETGS